MQTLKTIQTISKVCKILANVVFILSLVGAIILLIAIPMIITLPRLAPEADILLELIESEGGNMGTIIFSCAAGLVSCVGGAVVAKFAANYFSNELEDGTPFTYNGAKELLRLGILSLAIPAGISLLTSIAYGITKIYYPALSSEGLSNASVSIGTGLVIILISFVFKYGAEIQEKLDKEI